MTISVGHEGTFKEPVGQWVSLNGQWVSLADATGQWVSKDGEWIPLSTEKKLTIRLVGTPVDGSLEVVGEPGETVTLHAKWFAEGELYAMLGSKANPTGTVTFSPSELAAEHKTHLHPETGFRAALYYAESVGAEGFSRSPAVAVLGEYSKDVREFLMLLGGTPHWTTSMYSTGTDYSSAYSGPLEPTDILFSHYISSPDFGSLYFTELQELFAPGNGIQSSWSTPVFTNAKATFRRPDLITTVGVFGFPTVPLDDGVTSPNQEVYLGTSTHDQIVPFDPALWFPPNMHHIQVHEGTTPNDYYRFSGANTTHYGIQELRFYTEQVNGFTDYTAEIIQQDSNTLKVTAAPGISVKVGHITAWQGGRDGLSVAKTTDSSGTVLFTPGDFLYPAPTLPPGMISGLEPGEYFLANSTATQAVVVEGTGYVIPSAMSSKAWLNEQIFFNYYSATASAAFKEWQEYPSCSTYLDYYYSDPTFIYTELNVQPVRGGWAMATPTQVFMLQDSYQTDYNVPENVGPISPHINVFMVLEADIFNPIDGFPILKDTSPTAAETLIYDSSTDPNWVANSFSLFPWSPQYDYASGSGYVFTAGDRGANAGYWAGSSGPWSPEDGRYDRVTLGYVANFTRTG